MHGNTLFTPPVLLNPINNSAYCNDLQIWSPPAVLCQCPLHAMGMDSWDVSVDICYSKAQPGHTSSLCSCPSSLQEAKPAPWYQISRIFIFSEATALV